MYNTQLQNFLTFSARGCGNTYALIEQMLKNPNAIMIVSKRDFGNQLSREYGISRNRFITGGNSYIGQCVRGPVLIDIPVVLEILRDLELAKIDREKTENKLSKIESENHKLKEQNNVLRSAAMKMIAKFEQMLDTLDLDDIVTDIGGTFE